MLAILFKIDVLWLPFAMGISAVAGFALRSLQLRKLRKQVSSLEKEMLNSHAEILGLQEQMARLQSKNSNSKSLVVSMKDLPAAEESDALHPDVKTRKKVK